MLSCDKSRPAQVNPEEAKLAQWTTCRLSGDRLSRPVCTDELGFLYNKSAVVAGLVAKSLPPKLAHITSLKHLTELKLEDNKVRLTSRAPFDFTVMPDCFPLKAAASSLCTDLPHW